MSDATDIMDVEDVHPIGCACALCSFESRPQSDIINLECVHPIGCAESRPESDIIDVECVLPIGCACALCSLKSQRDSAVAAPSSSASLKVQLVACPDPPHALLACRQRSRCLEGDAEEQHVRHRCSAEVLLLRRLIKSEKQRTRRREFMVLKLRADLQKSSHELAIPHRGGASSRSVTWDGCTSCALRVTIGNVSAVRAGLVLPEQKLSRQTVSRYELHTSGALRFAGRCFHNAFLRSFRDGSAEACRGALCDCEILPNLLEDEPASSRIC